MVNTSRAELVGENALVSALNRGRPGMAAVDVFETEPILQGHPLLRLENAVCTPHIGYVEQDSYELYFRAAFDNVVNFIKNEPDQHRQPRAPAGASLRQRMRARRSWRRAASPSRPLLRLHTSWRLQGFGGVLPVAQHELVERQRWLTKQEFAETLSIAQVLPGPNVVNLCLIVG